MGLNSLWLLIAHSLLGSSRSQVLITQCLTAHCHRCHHQGWVEWPLKAACSALGQIEESVRSMVMRYGSRLWKLRVLQAEVKINIRQTTAGSAIPIRLFITNESGYYLDISLYKEVTDPRSGNVRPGVDHGVQVQARQAAGDMKTAYDDPRGPSCLALPDCVSFLIVP